MYIVHHEHVTINIGMYHQSISFLLYGVWYITYTVNCEWFDMIYRYAIWFFYADLNTKRRIREERNDKWTHCVRKMCSHLY